jgi:hypothetical protein
LIVLPTSSSHLLLLFLFSSYFPSLCIFFFSLAFSTSYEALSNLLQKSQPQPLYRRSTTSLEPPGLFSRLDLSWVLVFGFFDARTAPLRQSYQPTRLSTVVSSLLTPYRHLSLNLLDLMPIYVPTSSASGVAVF